VPNLGSILSGRRSGLHQARENLRRDFVVQVEHIYKDFLAENIDEVEREQIWEQAANGMDEAFLNFNVEGLTKQALRSQQTIFRRRLDEVLRQLLIDSLSALDSEQLAAALSGYVEQQAQDWLERIGEEEFLNFQRLLLLEAIDNEWRDYLIAMDDLRREIGLEAFAQKDPKVEYKRRSYQMFADMRGNIEQAIAEGYFSKLARHNTYVKQQEANVAYREQLSQAGYQVVKKGRGKGVELRRDAPKVGRNDPCPCGSGKKYKHCHLRSDQSSAPKKGKRPVKNR
jgi:preprotein translocase subunit SecA